MEEIDSIYTKAGRIKKNIIDSFVTGIAFGAIAGAGLFAYIGYNGSFQEGFHQGRGYQMCLSELEEDLDSRDISLNPMSFFEYNFRKNKCGEEYGLK